MVPGAGLRCFRRTVGVTRVWSWRFIDSGLRGCSVSVGLITSYQLSASRTRSKPRTEAANPMLATASQNTRGDRRQRPFAVARFETP